MGERYPLHIYGHGIENLLHFVENRYRITLERGETHARIDLRMGSPYTDYSESQISLTKTRLLLAKLRPLDL